MRLRRAIGLALASLALVAAGAACEGGGEGGRPDAEEDPPWRARLESLADYEGLLAPEDPGSEGGVKYVAPRVAYRGEPPLVDDCVFQDMGRWRWHVEFLRTFPETATLTSAQYNDLVLRNETRRWWGGTLRHWPAAVHPRAGAAGVFTYEIYAEETFDNPLPLAGIVEVAGTLADCVPFAADRLAFLPFGPTQTAIAELYREVLAEDGVTVVFPADVATP